MGGVNFVSEGEKKPIKQNKENEEKKLEWTSPDLGLEKPETEFSDAREKTSKGFFSWLGVFGKSKNNEKIKDKELLAEHKQNILKEKKNRGGSNAYTRADGNSDNGKSSLGANAWKAARTLKTDLIKDEMTTFFDWKTNITTLLVNVVIVCALVGLSYGGVVIWEIKEKDKSRDKEINVAMMSQKITGSLKKMEEVDRLRQELKVASALLSKHIYWTNFFDFLENNTLKNVSYADKFTGDIIGNYTLDAKTDGFADLVDQVRVMRAKEMVKDVKVTKGDVLGGKDGAEEDASAVGFSMSFSMNPKIFFKE